MCFSPSADLAAGAVIGAIGVDGLHHVRRGVELPLASVPVVLAAHQIIEAFVWWASDGTVPHAAGRIAAFVYLVIAFGVVPVLVPAAVLALEPPDRRRRLVPWVVAGAAVAAVLLSALVAGPYGADVKPHEIAYWIDVPLGGLVTAVYVAATCGSLLSSGDRATPAGPWSRPDVGPHPLTSFFTFGSRSSATDFAVSPSGGTAVSVCWSMSPEDDTSTPTLPTR